MCEAQERGRAALGRFKPQAEEDKAAATAADKDALPDKEDDGVVVDPAVLEATFVFCLVWSLGASVIQKHGFNDRDRVDAFVKKLAGFSCKEGEGLSPTTLPKASLYEYLSLIHI